MYAKALEELRESLREENIVARERKVARPGTNVRTHVRKELVEFYSRLTHDYIHTSIIPGNVAISNLHHIVSDSVSHVKAGKGPLNLNSWLVSSLCVISHPDLREHLLRRRHNMSLFLTWCCPFLRTGQHTNTP